MLSKVEPVGSDLQVFQMARVAQAMAGKKLEDHLLISTKRKQSTEAIFEAFRQFGATTKK